jgi:hypothetical protein
MIVHEAAGKLDEQPFRTGKLFYGSFCTEGFNDF